MSAPTRGDMKRGGSPLVRTYSMEVSVRVYPSGTRWLCEDHLGRVHGFPTEALAGDYAEGCIEDWTRLIREN